MQTVQPIKEKEKLEAIKKILRASSIRNELLFVLGINTGLRISDLLSLEIGDVSFRQKAAGKIEIKEKKTKKQRTIAISRKTCRLIDRYLQKERPNAEYDEPLFLSQKGGPITRQHAYDILNKAARAVGINDRIGTHSLRKTFGYFAYKEGVDLAMIQKLLNHSSQAETLRYIGITQEQMDEIVLRLDL
ncbi:tyrosine-type recombinase/integrase [Metabacillus fastidiosus]|uniref:tyrosine-type recombinase/integrase n=1 Tax=Metabacillus fastidiosus TaxID=1458 RepID=UPI002DB84247|nr:tyrosine-type recombinase/integrase [Metabacillus fastidiosus]MEC2075856.1 tyrosine-type recombinase/integrase [Metabacillus fastidiosus]